MYPRWIERRVRAELSDTRVVLLAGPRQAGKTTLAKKVAEEHAIHVTRTLREAAKILQIDLLDHVIVGDVKSDPQGRGYFSFREAGHL